MKRSRPMFARRRRAGVTVLRTSLTLLVAVALALLVWDALALASSAAAAG